MTSPGLEQQDLFGSESEQALTTALPEGWLYRDDFITPAEEAELLETIGALTLHEARYKAWTAKRRVAHFGTAYDFETNQLLPSAEVPEWLWPLRAKAAAWTGFAGRRFRKRADRRVPARHAARLAPRRAGLRGRRRRVARQHLPDADAPLSTGRAEEGRRAVSGSAPALGLRAAWTGTLGMAAQHRADAGTALVDHVPDASNGDGAPSTGCTADSWFSALSRLRRRLRRRRCRR
jgi:hypothetical protein